MFIVRSCWLLLAAGAGQAAGKLSCALGAAVGCRKICLTLLSRKGWPCSQTWLVAVYCCSQLTA